MRIDVYVHQADSTSSLEKKVDLVITKLGGIMAKVDELLAELEKANTTTNEIANDIADLIAKLANGLSAAEAAVVQAKLAELQAKLEGVAATHTPS